jgi:DNA-binding NarL/FixJ family response regulator
MTMNEDPELVAEAFRAGPSAFLLKQAGAFELTDAIKEVLKGRSYVTPSAAQGQAEIALRDPKAREHVAEPTPRQREVIQLVAEGRPMKEVASDYQADRSGRNGTIATEDQYRCSAIRHQAPNHPSLALLNFTSL